MLGCPILPGVQPRLTLLWFLRVPLVAFPIMEGILITIFVGSHDLVMLLGIVAYPVLWYIVYREYKEAKAIKKMHEQEKELEEKLNATSKMWENYAKQIQQSAISIDDFAAELKAVDLKLKSAFSIKPDGWGKFTAISSGSASFYIEPNPERTKDLINAAYKDPRYSAVRADIERLRNKQLKLLPDFVTLGEAPDANAISDKFLYHQDGCTCLTCKTLFGLTPPTI